MKHIGKLSRAELAGLVCKTLAENDIDVVLTGGSCVSIYSSEKYVSKDLDFVDVSLKSGKQIERALSTIGFERQPKNSRHFVHPDTELTVEFPSAPLAIGSEFIPFKQANEMSTEQGLLRLLSPTDCVKGRLANYYYFGDKQCFVQVTMVAQMHPVNLNKLKEWHRKEDQLSRYKDFLAHLKM